MATPASPRAGTVLAPLLDQQRKSSRNGGAPSGLVETGVPGVSFFWNDNPVVRSPLLYNAGIVVIAQGHKVGYLGGGQFGYDADTCLVLGVPVPFECEVSASRLEPLLGMRIDIDLTALHALVARFRGQLGAQETHPESVHAGVEPVSMAGPLLDATLRLIESLNDPIDREVVGAAAVDEIIYRILRGERGHVLHALTQHHTPYATIARALERMHRDYAESIAVEDLARDSAMSVSSFHRAFKQVTGDSPLTGDHGNSSAARDAFGDFA